MDGGSDIFDDLMASYKHKHENQSLKSEVDRKVRKINNLNESLLDLTNVQQKEFDTLGMKMTSIEKDYNHLIKIVHIKELEMKNLKELLEKSESDKIKYIEELKKYFFLIKKSQTQSINVHPKSKL